VGGLEAVGDLELVVAAPEAVAAVAAVAGEAVEEAGGVVEEEDAVSAYPGPHILFCRF
jgi:hypothetical protein